MTSDVSLAPLSEVADIAMGQSPPGSSYNDEGIGVPLVNGPAQFGRSAPVAEKWTTEPTKLSQEGDIVFCVRGSTTGRMVRADGTYVMGRGVAAIRGRERRDTSYIYYALHYVRPSLLQHATGSTFPNLSSRSLSRFELPWPDAPQRWAIAEVLGALDDRIEWARKCGDVIHDLAQAAGERVEHEATAPLRDLASIQREMTSAEELATDTWAHYSIPAFDDGQEPVVEPGEGIRSGKYRMPRNCVLVSKLNPTWHRIWLPSDEDSPEAICSTEFMPIVPEDVELRAALWAGLLSRSFNRQMRDRVTGSTGSHQRVRPDDLLACRVADVRTLDVGSRRSLDALAERLLLLRSERRRLSSTRNALLPELLSGELRVGDPARLLDAVA